MKQQVKNGLRRYSGLQLMLLDAFGKPKTNGAIANELDRRAVDKLAELKQRKPIPVQQFSMS